MPAVFQVSLGRTSLLNSAVKYNYYCRAIQKTRTFVRCIDTVLYRAVLWKESAAAAAAPEPNFACVLATWTLQLPTGA